MQNLDLNVSESGSGTPILWIHGFPLSSAIFRPQLAIRGARHIMPDLPGFGLSTPPPADDTTIDDYAILLRKLLEHLQVKKAVIAGVSMGGYIALALAHLAPEAIAGLILIDTRETADNDEARKGRYTTIEKVENEGTAPVVESMLPKMLTKSAAPELVSEVRQIMESSSVEGVVAALQAMAERGDTSAVLRDLRVPALIVVGEEDTITPPSDAARMAGGTPDATLVTIPGAGHLSNLEQPQAFNDAVAAFLQTIDSAR